MELGEFELKIADILTELPLGICCSRENWEELADKHQFHSGNNAFYQCIGYTPEEFAERGNNISRILVTDDRKRLERKMNLAASNPGRAYSDVFEVLRMDGTTSHIQWNAKCVVDERGHRYLISSYMSVEEFLKDQILLTDKLNREKQERRRLNDLIYEMPVGVAVLKGGNEIYLDAANSEFLRAKGYSMTELLDIKRPFTEYIYGADVDFFEDAIENCRDRKTTEELELRIITKSGKLRWEMMLCRLYYYRDAVPYYILTSWDIDGRKQLEDELHLMGEQYRMLEEVTDEFPFEYDVLQRRFRVPLKYHTNGKIPDTDKEYMDFEEMLADIYDEDQPVFAEEVSLASRQEMAGSVDYRLNIAENGKKPEYAWYRTVYRSIMGGNGQIIRIIGRSYDISSDREIQERLSKEMQLDPLTRLLNKVASKVAVSDFLDRKPEGNHILFLIDVDNFKQINDTFGHTVGDTVLCDIAQIIREQFSTADVVGRIGGDEFLVFMKNTSAREAEENAESLCREARKQLIGDDAVVNVTLSVGLAVYMEDGTDYETLFEMADRAMYRAKRGGKNSFSFAQKGEPNSVDVSRKEKRTENGYLRSREADKDFLNFAFSLLSHARDVNGSLNVLLEQIGKKFELDAVSVFEYSESKAEMTLTNYWSSYGPVYDRNVLPRTIPEFEEAAPGEFVVIKEEELKGEIRKFLDNWAMGKGRINHIAGIKFEFSGNRIGSMYIGARSEGAGFGQTEKSTLCELSRVVAVFVSLRNKIRDDQKEIQHLQSRDKLTGLYNLDAFRKRADELLREAARASGEHTDKNAPVYALVHVDINNFSYVNENFGQEVGDSILQEFADIIADNPNIVKACRMYSDYFIILALGSSREEIYDSIVEGNEKFEAQQRRKYPASTMRLSAGICFLGDGGESFDAVLEGANLARKQAKEQKNCGTVIYREEMRLKRNDELQITGRFYGAIQKGEFEVFLQPKFLLGEQKIYGAEALARWRLPSGELLPPARFIGPLENMGYIVDLDFYILEQLLRVMKRWKESGRELFTISTNFSRRNFENGGMDFVERLKRTMQRYEIEPQYIEIEVTESVIVEKLTSLKECLACLEEMGYRIAIDDFGTGYSSLSVLMEIPADVVKIDKSFTDRIDLSGQQEFVSHMGQFIRAAKEEVIFEGIESDKQRQFLIECGFSYGQGFLFDKPLPVEEFERKYI